MITPIQTMTIDQICNRQDDLLVSVDDIREVAKGREIRLLMILQKHASKMLCVKHLDCIQEILMKSQSS